MRVSQGKIKFFSPHKQFTTQKIGNDSAFWLISERVTLGFSGQAFSTQFCRALSLSNYPILQKSKMAHLGVVALKESLYSWRVWPTSHAH
jgi:hypothetical protein